MGKDHSTGLDLRTPGGTGFFKPITPHIPNALQYHEALDRCDIVQTVIQSVLLEHPVFTSRAKQNKAWRDRLIKAQTLIAEVYQKIGDSKEYAELESKS